VENREAEKYKLDKEAALIDFEYLINERGEPPKRPVLDLTPSHRSKLNIESVRFHALAFKNC
jgi:hypothetical protein